MNRKSHLAVHDDIPSSVRDRSLNSQPSTLNRDDKLVVSSGTSRYVELHARSAFSFLRGSATPEQLVRQAAEFGCRAMALCDRDGFYGSVRLHMRGKEQGVRGIVGTELTMEDGAVLPLLVETREAYQRLSRLITTAKLRAAKGESRVAWHELADAGTEGWVALTGDEEGPVVRAWRSGGTTAAEAAANRLMQLFGRDRLFVELQRHNVRGEDRRNRMLMGMAETHALPLLATNGVTHAAAATRQALDVLTCIREHTHLDAAGLRLTPNAERHVKTEAEMRELFRDLPEAILNTERLADRLTFGMHDLGYQFPTFDVPGGGTMMEYLKARVEEGARDRFGPNWRAIAEKQLNRELSLIGKLGFEGYFLVVWDLCKFCREHPDPILVQGRGSAANSAVCFALRITAVDPIKQRLLFERFLTENMKSWPDIDLDLPSGERRETVIREVYRRYAPRGAAMTANVITYRGRSTVREVGKALNLPENMIDRFSALYANGDFPHTIELRQQLKMAGLPESHPRLAAMINTYQQIKGLPRHLGQHSGGMVICRNQLDSVVPLEPASMPGRVVVQWDKDDCEDLGIVKVDLLGLGMMAAIQDSLEICGRRGGPSEMHQISHEDEATFQLMKDADTVGVFQIESRAQMATLPRMQPRCFYDVAIEVAIIRPGPIQGNAVNPYLKRRKDRSLERYPDERLRPILERTLGVILFQEQILEISMKLGGFSAAEADDLRRAIGFKRDESRLVRMTQKLRDAMRANGVSVEAVEEITQALATFALYGFPESHALSFALLAYTSTYLKVHHPAEFYAGLINNLPMGFYSVATLVQDARRRKTKVRVLPVCVRESQWLTTVPAAHTLRLGFRCIKGMREVAVKAMLAERAKAPFASMADFLRRTEFRVAERRQLALAGALNALAGHRRAAMWAVEQPDGADELFRTAAGAEPEELSPLEAMSHFERIAADYRTQSLTVGDHPMKLLRPQLPAEVLCAAELKTAANGRRVTVAGSVICRQRPGTAKGFVFVNLEDETGIANIVVRPPLFERMRLVITQEPSLMITGVVQSHENVVHVKAETIRAWVPAGLPEEASHDFH